MIKLAKIIKEYRIDVVNAHHYMSCFYSFFGTRVMNRIRLVYTEHSVPEVEGLANSIHYKIFHLMLYEINGVIGVSRAITEKFEEKYPSHVGKFYEVLNGVDIDKFQSKGMRESVRRKWGFGMDHFVVGTVANFRKIKNHVCLVRAANRLKDTHPQLRLFFVGTGFPGDKENSINEVMDAVNEYRLEDRVVFAGYQENISEILSSFDLFCLPSKSEGLPVSVLEAMAAGILVVGSNVSGIVEVVENGKTGILFSSDSDSDLALALEKIIARPDIAKLMAHNGFLFVSNAHNIKNWESKYSKILLAQ